MNNTVYIVIPFLDLNVARHMLSNIESELSLSGVVIIHDDDLVDLYEEMV